MQTVPKVGFLIVTIVSAVLVLIERRIWLNPNCSEVLLWQQLQLMSAALAAGCFWRTMFPPSPG